MKEDILIYQGYHDKSYCFSDSENKVIRFIKANSDLIWKFRLQSDWSLGKKFKAKYFNNALEYSDNYILSDMERIQ
jgi:hypothetical protein